MTCYIATTEASRCEANATEFAGNLDLSTQLPGDDNAASEQVVGTLDLNQGLLHKPRSGCLSQYSISDEECSSAPVCLAGLKLPSEELTGSLSEGCGQEQRAYLSNVCTAKAVQRQASAALASITSRLQGFQHVNKLQGPSELNDRHSPVSTFPICFLM